jgi:hypothetical protein
MVSRPYLIIEVLDAGELVPHFLVVEIEVELPRATSFATVALARLAIAGVDAKAVGRLMEPNG